MNLSEIARKLKIPTKDLKEKLPELGFDIGMKAIKVPDDMAAKIIEKWQEEIKRQRIASRHAEALSELQEKDKTLNADNGGKKIKLPARISVRDLAARFGLSAPGMIAELMKQGVMASLSEKVDYDICSIVGEGLGIKTELVDETNEQEQYRQEIQEKLKTVKENMSDSAGKRPPVVVVMGHVDHGKTKLLDVIRESHIIDSEAGGITQHIGAYQVIKNNKEITFIDTPGHEAFSAMRSRGANVADIAILVVAADDGIQPQTIEAIKMIQDAGLPMIVAINKIDKETADVEKVKKELAEINLIPEDWGGDVICIPISAKQEKNIDELLDMVILVADMNTDKIKAEFDKAAIGTVIESHLDKGTGPVATVLIHVGTLHKGETIKAGDVLGKVRAMVNWQGDDINKATPGMPVRIIGMTSVPSVGEILEAQVDLKSLKRELHTKKSKIALETLIDKDEENKKSKIKKLNLVLKTDVGGSLEAIVSSLKKFNNHQVQVNIVYKGLGNITEIDIVRAESTKAKVFGFHVSATSQSYELAKEKDIEIKIFQVIYKLIETVQEFLEDMLEPIIIREVIGEGKVLAIFRGRKNKMIIGAKLKTGEVKVDSKMIIYRDDKIIGEGKVQQLRIGPEEVKQVNAGTEFGLQYSGSVALMENDKIEFFIEKQEKQKLEIKK